MPERLPGAAATGHQGDAFLGVETVGVRLGRQGARAIVLKAPEQEQNGPVFDGGSMVPIGFELINQRRHGDYSRMNGDDSSGRRAGGADFANRESSFRH